MKKILIYVMLFLVFLSGVHATSLDDAKEVVDNYYLFSKEGDFESYSNLFDEDFVKELYGDEHEELFKEVFTYFEVEEYEIEYQYYTEGEESLTLFFNLKAEIIVEDSKIDIDNDLVALFSKKNDGLKIKYILLQETFIEQMNREVIFKGAIGSIVEENSDLIKEAENKNISLVDYSKKFEDTINKDNKLGLIIAIILITIIILSVVFKEKIKNKKVRGYVDKIEKTSKKTSALIKNKYEKNKLLVKNKYEKIKPVVKDKYDRGKKYVKKHTKKIGKKLKK